MLLVTHDLSECFELGDRMLVMQDGRAVMSGAPRDLLANPGRYKSKDLKSC